MVWSDGMGEKERAVLAYLQESPNCTMDDLKKNLTLPEHKIKAALHRLESMAKIEANKYGRVTRYKPYGW